MGIEDAKNQHFTPSHTSPYVVCNTFLRALFQTALKMNTFVLNVPLMFLIEIQDFDTKLYNCVSEHSPNFLVLRKKLICYFI